MKTKMTHHFTDKLLKILEMIGVNFLEYLNRVKMS